MPRTLPALLRQSSALGHHLVFAIVQPLTCQDSARIFPEPNTESTGHNYTFGMYWVRNLRAWRLWAPPVTCLVML